MFGNFNFKNVASGLPNLFSGIGDFFGASQIPTDYPNPANAAMPYYDKIPGTLSPYFNPYISAGKKALGNLQGQYGQLMNNPSGVMNQIGSHFQQSPGYQFQVNQALGAANRAAAAGGMAGSPMEQQQIGSTVNNLANQDYYNYLSHALGLYGAGLQGEEGLNQMGFQASTGLGEDLANALMSQGNLAYAGQENQNEMQYGSQMAKQGMDDSGWGQIGDFLGGLFGGGGDSGGGALVFL